MAFDGRAAAAVALLGLLLAAAGCNSSEAQFQFNRLFAQEQVGQTKTYSSKRAQEIVDRTFALFGTPDEPFLPPEALAPIDDVIDRDSLKYAAGPVKSFGGISKSGLYRQHCVHCHGISGDGQGPTALYLNPYPRDYRPGIFKFKSTTKGMKPTHDDLRKVIVDGIPGTAMPSFKLLTSPEIEALTNYVKYLTIRGEFERNLIAFAKTDVREDDPATPEDEYQPLPSDLTVLLGEPFYAPAVDAWRTAEAAVTPIPARPEWTKEEQIAAIAKGQQFFYGAGACYTCHGESQLGDGLLDKYDKWQEFLSPAKNPDGINVYLSLGAFPPRPVEPRNLRSGVYRGGRRPIDLYWRIKNGIDGSEMPGASDKLTNENIWELIEFVRSLPYQEISDPFNVKHLPNFQRPRN